VKTIVAPIDFSPVTDRVFDTAAGLADALRSRIVLLHVIPPPRLTSAGSHSPEAMQETIAASEQNAARRLARYEKRLLLDRLNVSKLLLHGEPAPIILEWSAKLGASFVVMGSHGHSEIAGRLIGGTTEGVLRKASCAVLIVPHPKISRSRPPWPEARGDTQPIF